jgi:hypothetical protein
MLEFEDSVQNGDLTCAEITCRFTVATFGSIAKSCDSVESARSTATETMSAGEFIE